MRALRAVLVWLLVGVGSAAIAYPALAYGTGALRQERLTAELRTMLGPAPIGPARIGPASTRAGPAASSPVERAPIAAFRPVEGQGLGILRIPSIGLEAAFLEGVSDSTLLAGPGHLPRTPLPGSPGVSVLAAHRDAHFRDLKEVALGDRVILRLPSGRREYRVTHRAIADPDDAWVTAPRPRTMLRLVTCWPPNFIGPAPQRLVVTAVPPPESTRVVSERPAPTSPPPPSATSAPLPTPHGEVSPAASPPLVGTAGATIAGLAAFGAYRSGRRLRWWFLPWVAGLGTASLSLLAAWAGPVLLPA